MKSREFLLGIFVIMGLVCLSYLTIKLGRMDFFQGDNYMVKAHFSSAAGLKTGSNIEIAGVKVGSVGKITLDQATSTALVEMYIQDGVEVTDDTIAAVKTSGLIGDKYISLTIGGSPELLTNNSTLFDTQSAVDIEELISKYVFGTVDN